MAFNVLFNYVLLTAYILNFSQDGWKNEVGLTHLRLVSGFCVLGGNRVGTCQNEKILIWKREGENIKSTPNQVSFCRKRFCPDVFYVFQDRKGECVK